MKGRGLLVATALLLVLGGGVFWSNREARKEESKPAKDASTTIVAAPEGDLRRLAIERRGSGATVIARDSGNKWSITAPQPLPVDSDAVNSLTGALSSLNADQVVEEKATDLSQYGLGSPSLEVEIEKKDGKKQKLLFGDDTPTGGNTYAMLAGTPKVYTVASATKSSLDKTSQDLRDRRLLTFDSEKITRVELAAKKSTVEFGKNNQNEWAILKPKPMRADGWQIEELVRKLKDAKMEVSSAAEEAKKAASAFASGTPAGTAKVTDASGTQTLEVRKAKDDYYARSSVVEGIHKVPSDLGTGLDKTFEDFRNKKLFDFAFSEPTKIEVKNGAAAPVLYSKTGDKWFAGTKQIDSTSLQNFVDKLRDLAAVKFPDSGFTTPVFEVSVTSNENRRNEKVLISKSGNDYFATRQNEATVYQLDSKAADDLIKAFSDIKPAQDTKKK
jgi:hypothetical protein